MSIEKIYISHCHKFTDRYKYITEIAENHFFFKNKTEIIISSEEKDSYYLQNNSYTPSLGHWNMRDVVVINAEQFFALFERIANSDNEIVMILEDDFILTQNFDSIIQEYMNNLPNDFDIIFLNTCCNMVPTHNHPVNKYFYEENSSRGACSIVITKNACKKLLNFRKYWSPIDWHLFYIKNDANLKYYWGHPELFIEGTSNLYYKPSEGRFL